MATSRPEPWLRGPIDGIADVLQPAAHAFVASREEITAVLAGFPTHLLWERVGGTASIGFHLVHLAGSTDRLLTYARAEGLSEKQQTALSTERAADEIRPSRADMLRGWSAIVDAALAQLGSTPEAVLTEPRFVGKARLPSTVLGLLFHAAEHASRHTGQIVTTAMVLRSAMDE